MESSADRAAAPPVLMATRETRLATRAESHACLLDRHDVAGLQSGDVNNLRLLASEADGPAVPLLEYNLLVVGFEQNEDDEESDSNEDGTYDEDDEDYVPPDYIFNSYFAYCLWGPFATEEKQLPLFLLGKFQIFKTDGDILIFAYTNTIHLFET